MRFNVVLQEAEGGYTVFIPSHPGCISEGDTKEGTLKNIVEVIELTLNERKPTCFSSGMKANIKLRLIDTVASSNATRVSKVMLIFTRILLEYERICIKSQR